MIAVSRRAFLASLAAVGTIPAAPLMVGDTPIPAPAPPTPPAAPDTPSDESGLYVVSEVTSYTRHDGEEMEQYTLRRKVDGHLMHTDQYRAKYNYFLLGDRVEVTQWEGYDGRVNRTYLLEKMYVYERDKVAQ